MKELSCKGVIRSKPTNGQLVLEGLALNQEEQAALAKVLGELLAAEIGNLGRCFEVFVNEEEGLVTIVSQEDDTGNSPAWVFTVHLAPLDEGAGHCCCWLPPGVILPRNQRSRVVESEGHGGGP